MPAYITEPPENRGRRQTVATVAFLLLGLVAVNLPARAQQPVASFLRATLLRPFVWTQETLTKARITTADNNRLQFQVDSMVAVSTARTHLVDENLRLRALLVLSERIGPAWVAASAIRSGTAGSQSIFHLDVGSNDGVAQDAPVITPRGLVGMVREVRPNTSVAMDWTHPDFRASAMDGDGLTYGFVGSRRGAFREEDRLHFDGTAFQTPLPAGTTVLTSGQGVFPRGIPIGRVTDVAEEEESWRRSYWLKPLVDPGSATHVLVATSVTGGPQDLTAIWPPDSVLTENEARTLDRLRLDSVPILRDSVGSLLQLLELRERPDSIRRSTGGSGGPGGGELR